MLSTSKFSRLATPFIRSFKNGTVYKLPSLPFAPAAMSPLFSAKTMECHYNGHHQTYVNTFNTLTAKDPENSLEWYIMNTKGPVYNQASQIYNHNFFWNTLTPTKQDIPAELKKALEDNFQSIDAFKAQFAKVATSHFGSGWVWLVKDKSNKLSIISTKNEYVPIKDGFTPLMTIDVWEHAYYLDYQFKRAQYIDKIWDYVNWNFVLKSG